MLLAVDDAWLSEPQRFHPACVILHQVSQRPCAWLHPTPRERSIGSSRCRANNPVMDSAAPEEDESIFHLAGQCEKSFSLVNAVLKAVNAEFTSLLEEYQYRFLTWTAYLGVFAERDVCLDRRLRHHPELQDIVVRYLDIVQRNLNQRQSSSSTTAARGWTWR